MNKSKYVFAQLVEILDNDKFRHLVDKYEGNASGTLDLRGPANPQHLTDGQNTSQRTVRKD